MGFDQMHIRHCILYKFKKGSKASQAARNIRSVYKNEAPSIRICQRWFKQFESENFTLEVSLQSGRPSSVPQGFKGCGLKKFQTNCQGIG